MQLPSIGASERPSSLSGCWESALCLVAHIRSFPQGTHYLHIQPFGAVNIQAHAHTRCDCLQVAAVEALTSVVELQLISGSDVVDLLLPSVLANINVVGSPDEVWALLSHLPHAQSSMSLNNCSSCIILIMLLCFAQVVNAWLKCFHALVPLLDKALIKAKILPVALAKGANDETSVQSRVICCAMLGSMAAVLTKVGYHSNETVHLCCSSPFTHA